LGAALGAESAVCVKYEVHRFTRPQSHFRGLAN